MRNLFDRISHPKPWMIVLFCFVTIFTLLAFPLQSMRTVAQNDKEINPDKQNGRKIDTGDTVDALTIDPRNVPSGKRPANVTKSALAPAAAQQRFAATLAGSQEVPPNASTATGSATVVLNEAQTSITVNVTFAGLTGGNASAAHIHTGAPGVSGPVIIPLSAFPAATAGSYSNTFAITPTQVASMQAGNTYVNIHDAVFPGGEIRGQLALMAPPVGEDVGSEIEPNNTFATATTLTGSNVKIRGDVYPNADEDWYKFTAAAGNRVYAAVMTSYSASASTDSQLRIFGSDGTTLVEFDEDDGSLGGLSSSIAGAVMPAGTGTYYIQVKHFSATSQLRPYELYLSVRSGAPTPEVEPNDTQATANVLPASGFVSGARDPAVATEQDWYSFTANAGDTVYLGLDLDPERDNVQWNGRLGLALFGDATNQILVVDDASVGSAANPLSEAMFMTVKTAGTYYAFVDSATAATGGPTATYNLSVTVIPKANVGVNCTTYTSTNVPLPIADGALTSSTITVPATTARIASTRVSINATHTLMADMDVNLRSPNSNDNGLFNDIGSTATGGQTMMDITLDQYSSGVPFAFTVVRPMVLKPELNYRLDWFDGENPSGVWTLDIRDDTVNATTGTLNGWSLEICEQPAVAGSVVYTQDFEANNGGYTHSGAADEWQYGTPATAATTTTNPIAAFIGCNSGTNCWKTDLTGTYEISSNQDLVSPSIVLPATGTLNLSWAQRYQMETATFDHARVVVTEVGNPSNNRTVWEWKGATMTVSVGTTPANIGESAGWGIYNADISDFVGKTVNITFHVDSDASINFAGLAIDDVGIRNVPRTAAGVNVSGRVLTPEGRGLSNARVTITDQNGQSRTTITGARGYYSFGDIESGQSYIIGVRSRRYVYSSRLLQLTDSVADFDFMPE